MSKLTRRVIAVLSLTPCFLLSGHDVRPVVKKGVRVVATRCGFFGHVRVQSPLR